MKKSIFATHLKEAMKNKNITQTYNGKTKIIKRYRQIDLANDIGFSLDTVKSWTRTGGHIPTMNTLKTISDLLDVDVQYLLGEQECQRNANQTICNVTRLNEQSAKVLTKMDGIYSDAMNELLNHKDFLRLLLTIFEYSHSHNNIVEVINTLDNSKMPTLGNNSEKEIMKYRAAETFSKILDDLYNIHEEEMKRAKLGKIYKDMKQDIEKYIELSNNADAKCSLIKLIEVYQNRIKQLSHDDIICKFTPEQIIDNYDMIQSII